MNWGRSGSCSSPIFYHIHLLQTFSKWVLFNFSFLMFGCLLHLIYRPILKYPDLVLLDYPRSSVHLLLHKIQIFQDMGLWVHSYTATSLRFPCVRNPQQIWNLPPFSSGVHLRKPISLVSLLTVGLSALGILADWVQISTALVNLSTSNQNSSLWMSIDAPLVIFSR